MIGTILLSGCASLGYDNVSIPRVRLEVYCPEIKNYSKKYVEDLSNELSSLPEDKDYFTVTETISDYAALRDKLRACKDSYQSFEDEVTRY